MKNNKKVELANKRPQIFIRSENLHLDPLNPRLPEEIQGKSEDELCYALYRFFDVEELAYSMATNGYFHEEPLVAYPNNLPDKFLNISGNLLSTNSEYIDFINDKKTQFIVVEGNRRLSTIKLLLSMELRYKYKINSLPEVSQEIIDDLSKVPVIIYSNRKEILPYLGARHISGIKKWEPYAKARYIAHMIENGYSLNQVQSIVADRTNSASKFYLCYQIVEQMKNEFDIKYDFNKDEFSYL